MGCDNHGDDDRGALTFEMALGLVVAAALALGGSILIYSAGQASRSSAPQAPSEASDSASPSPSVAVWTPTPTVTVTVSPDPGPASPTPSATETQPPPEADGIAGRIITGTMTVSDVNGALVVQVGGYPGQPLTELGMARLNRVGRLLDRLVAGDTFPCPQGAGGGYSDIAVGTPVVVEDGTGALIGTSTLSGGVLSDHGCRFDFTVAVPDTDFYQVTVSHRGALPYSRAQLVAQDWQVDAKV